MKQVLFSLICAVAWPAALLAQLGADPATFFKPGPEAPETLPADRLYPNGTQMLFSFFSVGGAFDGGPEKQPADDAAVRKAMERYKKNGFKVFGPQYELNDRALEDAREHGLKVVYTIKYGRDRLFHDKEPVVIDPDEVRETVAKAVRAVADNPAIAAWYLQPEELRPWRKDEMTFLEAASKAIRETDPQKRPLWLYDPAHANAKRLASIAPWVDYLGKGMYTNYAGKKDERVWVRWSMEQEEEAIRISDARAVPITVPEMYHDSRRPAMTPEEIAAIPTWARHDTYLSLVCGAKGVVVFSMRERPSLPPEAWAAYEQAYSAVARELLEGHELGKVFLFGEKGNDVKVEVAHGPDTVSLLFPSGGVKEPLSYPSVAHRELAYGAARYLFLVNSAAEAVDVMVGGLPYAAAQAEPLLHKEAAFPVGEGEFQVTLAPLEVRAYRLTRRTP